ncbi:Proteasome-activating nucleotidase [uncultured archaeon]|nr:Proteasome-activating nucleotidase [uncultured archaeon]
MQDVRENSIAEQMPAQEARKLDSMLNPRLSDDNWRLVNLEAENRVLKDTVTELRAEIDKFSKPPLIVTSIVDIISSKEVIIRLNSGDFEVGVSKSLEGKLNILDRVLVDQKSLTIVKKIGVTKHFDVSNYVIIEKPTVSWNDIGGLKSVKEELQEVIELPLLKPDLFKQVGIDPPKGVLLYGPPGTGKTLLAKAAAATTNATFIEIVGSELVQKFIGEGSKFVKSIFDLAREKAPAIIFIDELDAIAATRIDVGTSGEREVQRTFMQLLSEIDGFKPLGNIKVIGATNRLDILDPAITRPGRLDRLIKVEIHTVEERLEILKIHTRNMSLDSGVSLDKIAQMSEKMSGAELKAICTEAGYFAIRTGRTKVAMEDFLEAVKKVKKPEKKEHLSLYGDA